MLTASGASAAAPTLELYDNWWSLTTPNLMTFMRAAAGDGDAPWTAIMTQGLRALGAHSGGGDGAKRLLTHEHVD